MRSALGSRILPREPDSLSDLILPRELGMLLCELSSLYDRILLRELAMLLCELVSLYDRILLCERVSYGALDLLRESSVKF